MIISASRRTDIPAFFNDWFSERLRRGTVWVSHPFNPRLGREVSLSPRDVDAYVFWTRWPRPFFPSLDRIERQGIPYYFLISLTDYPALLEPDTPSLNRMKAVLGELRERIGRCRIVWRYDPIVVSSITNLAYHKTHFPRLAGVMAGFCERVIVSYLDRYGKVTARLKRTGIDTDSAFCDPSRLLELNHRLLETAVASGLEIQSCAEPKTSAEVVIPPGKCVDAALLNRLFGLTIPEAKDPGQRKWCGCQTSVDIGTYATCRFHCAYCYAR